jgi:DNA-binding response OmpR family regulator
MVLLDLGLPDLDGLDVCRALRARSDVPLIVVSGRACATEKIVALELGADDYVVKPFLVRSTKTLDTHVTSLRHKLGGALCIEAVRGVGFRLVITPDAPSEVATALRVAERRERSSRLQSWDRR